MIASAAGGIEIEQVAEETPEKIIKAPIDPLLGLQNHNVLDLAIGIEMPRELWNSFTKICQGLWEAFEDHDAMELAARELGQKIREAVVEVEQVK